jgi:adenylate cyclase
MALGQIGQAHFFRRRFEEAKEKLLLAIQDDPGSPTLYRTLAACYAHMGRIEEARAMVAKLCTITPVVLLGYVPFRDPEHRELYLSGLRLAIGEAE